MKPAGLVTAILVCAALAGCGASGGHTPSLAGLPLPRGAAVTLKERTCDRGANAYCSLQLVVVGRHYQTSQQLVRAERRLLEHHHWAHENAPVGIELAADSPSDRIRVTYATAGNDLQGVDRGWIKRVRPVTLALSHAMFANTSAMSMLLVLGTG
jgi:hypothetical protein